MSNDLSDSGSILFASGDGAGTFVDVKGNPGVVRTLSAAHWIASDWFFVGAWQTMALTVSGQISSSLASVTIAVESRRIDKQNLAMDYFPAIVGTVRSDQPDVAPAASQSIALADLLRGAGTGTDQVSSWDGTAGGASAAAEILDVRLLTKDAVLTGQCRVLVLCANAPQAADFVRVAVNRG